MAVLQSLDAKVLGTDSFGLTNYDKLKDDIDLLIRSADGILSPGLYKLWDSTEAGVVFPTASITTPPLPQTFKHLLVVFSLQGTANGFCNVRVNSDASAIYWEDQMINGVFSQIAAGTGWNWSYLGAAANVRAVGRVQINNYSDALLGKSYVGGSYIQNDGSGTQRVFDQGGMYNSSAAVSTLTFISTAGNLAAGTRITVYGEA